MNKPQTEGLVGVRIPFPSVDDMREKPLLAKAQETIEGARQQDYGDKLQNFSQIAMIWQGILAPQLAPGQQITPELVALCMIGVKMARLSKSPDHKDSILDVAGYAGCYDILQRERNSAPQLVGATIDPRANRGS